VVEGIVKLKDGAKIVEAGQPARATQARARGRRLS
jgi:hypothetical protein